MRAARLLLGLCLSAFLIAVRAEVALPAVVARSAAWEAVGSGSLNWFVFRVYDATLWRAGDAQALAIRYARDIPASALVDVSVDEMQRLGVPKPERWRGAMRAIFPDVQAGEVLVAVARPAGAMRFFHRESTIGTVSDADFGDAFFSIWLDPRTREPALRDRLLGASQP